MYVNYLSIKLGEKSKRLSSQLHQLFPQLLLFSRFMHVPPLLSSFPHSFTFVYAQNGNLTISKFPTSYSEGPVLKLRPNSYLVPMLKTAWPNLKLQSNLERNEIK